MKVTPDVSRGAGRRRRPLAAIAAWGTAGALLLSGLIATPALAEEGVAQPTTADEAVAAAVAPAMTVTPEAGIDGSVETTLTIDGTGYATTNANGANYGGAYVLFGVVTPTDESDPTSWSPSKGGASGKNYDYAPEAGVYQSMVNYPGNETEPGVPYMDASGNWSSELLIPGARFTSQGGKQIDCYVQQCGVITIGAHGQVQGGVEAFAPVNFAEVVLEETTTTVAAQESGYYPTAFAGQDVALSATVAPADVAGSVEFFAGETSLGKADVSDGAAALTTKAFTGGAHSVRAVFTPSDAAVYAQSTSDEQIFRIVDLSPVVPTIAVGAKARDITGATLNWNVANWVSAGSGPAREIVSGDDVAIEEVADGADAVTRASRNFIFSKGSGSEDFQGNRVVSFTGTVRLTSGTAPSWTISDPQVFTNAQGDGYVTAEVQTAFAGSLFGMDDETKDAGRIVVTSFTGGTLDDADASGSFTATPIFEGQFAAGTWLQEYTGGSVSNAFLSATNSMIRSYFLQSGANADPTKPGRALDLSYSLGEKAAEPTLQVSPSKDLDRLGADVKVTGTGFDATAVSSWSGQPAGVYVSLGWVADSGWQPSQGAASATRVAVATKWVQETEATGGDYVKWTRSGDDRADFEFTLTGVTASQINAKKPAEGDYHLAVYAIGAGGVKQAANELAVDVSLAGLPFTDVDASSVHYPGIEWVYDEGITTGTKPTLFSPKQSVNRAQMALFLYRLAGEPEVKLPSSSPYPDVKTSDVSYKAIVWLKNEGLTEGVKKNGKVIFDKSGVVTRGQMAAFLYRFSDSPSYTPPAVSEITDVPKSSVFYTEINWLASVGVTTPYATPSGEVLYRPKNPVLREQMATFLHRLDSLEAAETE